MIESIYQIGNTPYVIKGNILQLDLLKSRHRVRSIGLMRYCGCLEMMTGFLLSASALAAADFYATPQGSGNRDGSAPDQAADGASISKIFNDRMKPGDRLVLGAGNYSEVTLSLAQGGTADQPKIIEGPAGDPTAVFSSSWTIDAPDKGATAIQLAPGLSGVTIKNISIKNYCFSIRAAASKETPRTHLTFENISMEQMRHGFYLSDCDDLTLNDCRMKRYSKHGFRFEQGCDRVTVKNCIADCSEGDAVWETKTEVFPFGFNINSGGAANTQLLFEDCTARNHIKSNQTVKYTNGDGFVAEGNTTGVKFLRCHAFRNQDGGFDLKVKDVELIDCIATGHRRDFRIWSTGTLTNCFGGWSTTGVWSKGGPIAVNRSTFHAHRKNALEMDEGIAPVTLTGCIISADPANADFEPKIGKVELIDTIVPSTGDPKFSQPDPKWDGAGSALDSTAYPDKGFSSTRVAKH